MPIVHENYLKNLYDQAKKGRNEKSEKVLKDNDECDRKVVMQFMAITIEPSIEDYYYAGNIFLLSKTPADKMQALVYFTKAINQLKPEDDLEIAISVRKSYAVAYDFVLLFNSQPQKYGTIYAEKEKPELGQYKNELVPPRTHFNYDFEQMERDRAELGLSTLDQQEKSLEKTHKHFKPVPRYQPKKDVKDEQASLKRKASPLVCNKCHMLGHTESVCVRPRPAGRK